MPKFNEHRTSNVQHRTSNDGIATLNQLINRQKTFFDVGHSDPFTCDCPAARTRSGRKADARIMLFSYILVGYPRCFKTRRASSSAPPRGQPQSSFPSPWQPRLWRDRRRTGSWSPPAFVKHRGYHSLGYSALRTFGGRQVEPRQKIDRSGDQ
jgi:hypothetical protein